jgi:hypothetical protein
MSKNETSNGKVISTVTLSLTREQAHALMALWKAEDEMEALQNKNLAKAQKQIYLGN